MSEYTALTSLGPPGSLVYGYHRGDPVDAAVVANWGLEIGPNAQVIEGPLPDAVDPAAVVMDRPGPEATRVQWEAYAVANGVDPEDAATVSQDELEAVQPATADRSGDDGDRPAESAKKAAWVEYVSAHGSDADKAWATADGTTKAELIAWQPAGDPIAVDASERANTDDGV